MVPSTAFLFEPVHEAFACYSAFAVPGFSTASSSFSTTDASTSFGFGSAPAVCFFAEAPEFGSVPASVFFGFAGGGVAFDLLAALNAFDFGSPPAVTDFPWSSSTFRGVEASADFGFEAALGVFRFPVLSATVGQGPSSVLFGFLVVLVDVDPGSGRTGLGFSAPCPASDVGEPPEPKHRSERSWDRTEF